MHCLLFHFPVETLFTLVNISLAGLQKLWEERFSSMAYTCCTWFICQFSLLLRQKKDSWGVFYLDRPPHSFINLWIYIVRGFHPYSLTSHCNWRRLSCCGRCRKDRIEAQISKFILIYLFYTKKWLMHKSD